MGNWSAKNKVHSSLSEADRPDDSVLLDESSAIAETVTDEPFTSILHKSIAEPRGSQAEDVGGRKLKKGSVGNKSLNLSDFGSLTSLSDNRFFESDRSRVSLSAGAGGQGSDNRSLSSEDSQDEDNDDIKELIKERKYGDWTQKLFTAVWMNFAMKLRNPSKTFIELVIPAVVCGIFMATIWFGNSTSPTLFPSTGDVTALMYKKNDIKQNGNTVDFDKSTDEEVVTGLIFATITKDKVFEHFCSRKGTCAKDGLQEKGYHIVYSPKCNFTDALMINTITTLQLHSPGDNTSDHQLVGVENSKDLYENMKKYWKANFVNVMDSKYPIGVNFIFDFERPEDLDSILHNMTVVPKNLRYSIRSYHAEIANTIDPFPIFDRKADDVRLSPFIHTGFVAMQIAIDISYTDMLVKFFKSKGHTTVSGLRVPIEDFNQEYIRNPQLQQYNFPIKLDKSAKFHIWIYISYSIIIGYICSTYSIVTTIISESDKGAFEILKIHGMNRSLPWIAYLINSFLYRSITATLLVLVFYFILVYDEFSFSKRSDSHVFLFWCFLVLHGVAMNVWGSFIASLFKKPTFGASFAVLLDILSFTIPSYILINDYRSRVLGLFLCLLLPHWCLSNGVYHFLAFQPYAKGLNWYDLANLADDDYVFYPTYICCVFFMVSIALYTTWTILGEKITEKHPSSTTSAFSLSERNRTTDLPFFEQDDNAEVRESIIHDHFNETWFDEEDAETWVKNITPTNYDHYLENDDDLEDLDRPATYEPQPPEWKSGFKCRDITKTYSYDVILEKINLDFYRGEITCLTGGNGMGKTTLLLILAGILKPTFGTVSFFLPSNIDPQTDTEAYTSTEEDDDLDGNKQYGTSYSKNLGDDSGNNDDVEKNDRKNFDSFCKTHRLSRGQEDNENDYSSSDEASIQSIEGENEEMDLDDEVIQYDYDNQGEMSSEAEEDDNYIYEAGEDLGKTNYGEYIGFCPQKIMLFDYLSVEEHIRIVCLLHGLLPSEATENFENLLKMFSLWSLRRTGVGMLSKCQQRKLSVALAFVSNPIVVILDEPTTDMDIYSVREFWSIMRELKQDRTIIVTTSTMDEADRYCDKIGYLSHGRVLCWGSPPFLKRYYTQQTDIQYYLTVKKGDSFLDKLELMNVLSAVKGIKELTVSGFGASKSELMFSIPPSFTDYTSLLENLEELQEIIGHTRVSLKPVDLLKVFNYLLHEKGYDKENELAKEELYNTNSRENQVQIDLHKVFLPYVSEDVNNARSFSARCHALWRKKFLYTRQKYYFFLTDYLVPISLAIFLALCANVFLPATPSSPLRPLSIYIYDKPTVFLLCNKPGQEQVLKAYKAVLKEADVRVLNFGQSIEEELSKVAYGHLGRNHIVSFDCFTALYSASAPFSAPIAYNILINMLLWMISPNRKDPYTISLAVHPVPLRENMPVGSIDDFSITIFGVLFSLVFAMNAASKISFPIMEKRTGMKLMQLFTGVSPGLLYNMNMLVEVLINIVVAFIIIAIVFLFDLHQEIFIGKHEKLTLFAIFGVHLCCAVVPYSYCLSTFFSCKDSGYGKIILLHFVTGIIPISLTFQVLQSGYKDRVEYLTYFLHIFPAYTISSAMVHYYHLVAESRFCRLIPKASADMCIAYSNYHYDSDVRLSESEKSKMNADLYFSSCCRTYCEDRQDCHEYKDILTWSNSDHNIAIHLMVMVGQGAFFWILTMLMEYGFISGLIVSIKHRICGDSEHKSAETDFRESPETEEVRIEREAIDFMIEVDGKTNDNCAIVIHDVCKFFEDHKVVDHINLTIPKNSITCLLGQEGSGKSSLLQILTGQITASTGNIYIGNTPLRNHSSNVLQNIGICFEENMFFRHLTGLQMMELMGQLRGIPQDHNQIQIQMWLAIFGINKEAVEKCSQMSPGTLRKLSIALTLIGNSKILFFDEPTRHLDPTMHHSFWNVIQEVAKNGQTIVITSKNADDANFAANKIALLGEGQLCTVGTPDFVNSKYNTGMSIIVYYRHPAELSHKANIPAELYVLKYQLEEWFQTNMSPCEILANQDNLMIIHVMDSSLRLSSTHDALETLKKGLSPLISSYVIEELTLDDILRQITRNKNLEQLLEVDAMDEEEVEPTDDKGDNLSDDLESISTD